MENIDLLAQSMTQTYFLMLSEAEKVQLLEDFNSYALMYQKVYEKSKSSIIRAKQNAVMRPFGEDDNSLEDNFLESTIIK